MIAPPTDPAFQDRGDACVPVFRVLPARGQLTGLVFASAHSGDFYPADMRPVTPPEHLRTAEDAWVDRLIVAGADHGADVITCNVARAYVDLNRSADDLDPLLVRDCAMIEASPKAVAGYGVVHRLSGDGRPLYDRWVDMAEVSARLDLIHRPYHQALAGLMSAARDAAGRAVLVDWHSMPARATGPAGPDIILGDRFGSSCDAGWTRRIRSLFEAQGLRVGLNRPYAGGHTTRLWGRPDEGFHAIQIEITRRLYWDEARHEPSAGWKRCRSLMERVIAGLCDGAQARPQAAE